MLSPALPSRIVVLKYSSLLCISLPFMIVGIVQIHCLNNHNPSLQAQIQVLDSHRHRRYSRQTLETAIESVARNKMSIAMASRVFNVPESTLQRKVPLSGKPSRRTALLNEEQEKQLVQLMMERQRQGFPMTKSEVCREATKMLGIQPGCDNVKRRMPNWFWLVYFLRRHPYIPTDYFKSQIN